jgi:gliding motility-associated-like protein
MIIWRRTGCTPIDTSLCNTGLDPSTGYVAIGRVPIGTTTFLDNNNGAGLDPGMEYSYRLTADFAPPSGGESLPSAEACTSLVLDVPFLTNVSVTATDSLQGQILIRWAQPRELNTALNPGPYRYELYRAVGFTGSDYVQVMSRTVGSVTAANDTVFLDGGLNTAANPYNYLLLFYTGAGIRDSTSSASSVRLTTIPQVNAIELSWQAQVPWNNTNNTHRVYRESRTVAGSFELIAEVAVRGEDTFRYVDSGGAGGLDADSTYCYYVDTYGAYNNQKIISPLINRSQISCAVPIDTLKPCPPVLSIDEINCETLSKESYCNVSSFSNNLTWSDATKAGAGCDTDVVAYRLYYKRYEEDETFTLLATISSPVPPDTLFTHSNLTSFAGCYYVTAVDEDGDESDPSNIVCKDNCPYYELPNVITPNGDGKNDEFVPFDCPRFVESVKFTVYNRWGRPVFETTESIFINWDGRLQASGESSQGGDLSAGVYYYLAEVRFTRLRRSDERVQIKGWVHILK